jgi:hypothetical protein
VTTHTRIARFVTAGSALGAAARLYEEPANLARFYHLVASTLMAFHAVSRHPLPLNDHEAAAAYLTPRGPRPLRLRAQTKVRSAEGAPDTLWVRFAP